MSLVFDELLAGSVDNALRMIAERYLYARMCKSADAHAVQAARQSLGVLGADEPGVNSALAELRKGKVSPGQAAGRMRAAVPGALTQIKQLPASLMTAGRQGLANEAVAQADVLGLKNINPVADNFSPTTAATSLGLGLGTAHLQSKLRQNRRLFEAAQGLLHGAADAAKDQKGSKGQKDLVLARLEQLKLDPKFLHAWRRKVRTYPDLGEARLGGGLRAVRNQILGPLLGPRMSRNPQRNAVRLATLEEATRHMPHAGGLAGRLALPLSIAALPLLYREWAGRGYRSGQKPVETLVNAAKPGK